MVEINNLYTLIFKVDEGSGICLKFEAEKKCYILTAYHCIKDSILQGEEIELLNDNNIPFNKKGEISFDEEKDIALIEIEYISDLLTVEFESKISADDDITFIGYPKKALGRKRKRLNGKIDEWNNKKAIKITESINGDFTEEEKTIEVFSGFSGSGVFRKRGQKLTLVGLLKSLPEENFDYKEISCIAIEDIKELIDEVRKKEQKNDEIIEEIRKSLGIELVKVELKDKTLYVGKYPVTFEEYDRFYDEKKDLLKLKRPENTHFFHDKRGEYPVVNVNWYDATHYCVWLKEKSGKAFKLPSVIDWDNIIKIDKIEDSNICCKDNDIETIKPICEKRASSLGLCDMYGNIHEWCYSEDEEKPVKGGSFNYTSNEIYSDEDKLFLPTETKDIVGFRILLKKD